MPRFRKTKADIQRIKDAIWNFAQDEGPVTVRQVFYRLTTLGLITKSEAEYRGTVSRLMTEMRENGELDWDSVEDATRYTRAPQMYEGPKQLLEDAKRLYRRNIWSTQPVAVEVWLEKEALAGIAMSSTAPFGVGLFVNKGYGSATFIHDAAERIDNRAELDPPKRTHILYFGDWDPSGADMSRDLNDRLQRYTEVPLPHPDIEGAYANAFQLHRLALRPEHIKLFNLPTRPTKSSDPRAATFTGESVELDALPPQVLRDLVRVAIEQFIDKTAMAAVLLAEKSERDILANIAASMTNGSDDDDEEKDEAEED